MSEDKSLKPKSFRVDDQTADKIKQISSEIGGNQQETLAKLIEAYEFQQGKAILTDKKEDIIAFEKYITLLTRMFMSSLEDNQNITETVKGQYDALLISKDSIIQDIQSKLTASRQLKEVAVTRSKELTDENITLNTRVLELAKMLEDKDSLNQALSTSCNDLRKTIEDSQEEMAELKKIAKEHRKLLLERDHLIKEKIKLEDQLMSQEQQHIQSMKNIEKQGANAVALAEHKLNTQLEKAQSILENEKQQANVTLEKALLDLEKQFQKQFQATNDKNKKEIDKYQQKYFDIVEKFQNKEEHKYGTVEIEPEPI